MVWSWVQPRTLPTLNGRTRFIAPQSLTNTTFAAFALLLLTSLRSAIKTVDLRANLCCTRSCNAANSAWGTP
jgi:hypothetical protein